MKERSIPVPLHGVKNAKLKIKNANAVGFSNSLNSSCTAAAEY
jgi:hypothetical protein